MEALIICVQAPLLLVVYASDDFEECKKLVSFSPQVLKKLFLVPTCLEFLKLLFKRFCILVYSGVSSGQVIVCCNLWMSRVHLQ